MRLDLVHLLLLDIFDVLVRFKLSDLRIAQFGREKLGHLLCKVVIVPRLHLRLCANQALMCALIKI